MPQPSRAAIWQVLERYIPQYHGPHSLHPATCQCPWLIKDLMAIWSPPDRAGLRESLKALYRTERNCSNRSTFAHINGEWDEVWLDRLIDWCLTWAEGRAEPTWCEHLLWSEDWKRWYGQATDHASLTLANWQACPICAAPRPAREA